MTAPSQSESIEEQVLEGGNLSLEKLAARGMVPLPPERLIPLQIKLAASEIVEVAELATEALAGLDAKIVAPVLARDSATEALEYFAEHSDHPLIIETIVRVKDVPHSVLSYLASRVPGDLQEVLILRQDAILAEPGILDALESNPELRDSVRRRVGEYRDHLLPREPQEVEEAVTEPVEEDVDATPEEVVQAISEAFLEPVEGEFDEATGLSEGQIRTLPVPVRLQLSRGAGKTLRDILIRDSNPLVAVSVMKFNTYSDGEVERIARMRTVVEDVLESIGRSSRWVRKYPIALALVKNPRTPIPIAVGLVPRMGVKDLRILRKDRNVSEAVRTRANRLYLLKMR